LNLFAIFSKTGKGVQEASGKTSHLSRADRNVLKEIDGKSSLANISAKFDKIPADKFEALIAQLDKDGYIREVSSGTQEAPKQTPRPAAPAAKAPPPKADDGDEALDFTQAIKMPPRGGAAPKGSPVDLAAAARAGAERKAKDDESLDYKARQEFEAKAKAEGAKAKAEAEQKARAAAEAKARAEAEAKARAAAEAKAAAETKAAAEAKARADSEAKTRAEADAKVKAAREAAVRMATEAKAKAEAESKKLEAEMNAKLDAERKAREEAEKRAAEAADSARKELEEKAKRDAEELRQRLEAEMKAKLDEERKAREAEDRKRREEEDRKRAEEDRKRREEDERRRKEDDERRAKEAAERKAREEEDRKRREEDERRRKEDDERRTKEEAERKALEETDRRLRRDEEERRAKEEAGRRAKEDAERKAREEADRKRRDEDDRRRREEDERRRKEDDERRAKEAAERKAREEADAKARAATSASVPTIDIPAAAPPPPPPPAASSSALGDDLLADLDSFGKREEEEQRAKEEAERKAKADAERKAKEAAERKAKEEAEKKRREEEERRRKEEEARRAQEEADRRAREEEEQRAREEAERKRKAKESLAAKQAEEKATARAAAGKGGAARVGDDIDVSEDDLETDDLKRDQKVVAEAARKAAREAPPVVVATGRPRRWGKPAAVALFVLLVAGVGVLHVMPLSTADYEKAASGALGVPVKISSARLSVITGVEVKLEGVTVGDSKIRLVRGFPEVGSLFGARKAFTRLELEGASLSQAQLADAVLGKAAGENFKVGRVQVRQATLDGPMKVPALDIDAVIAADGSVQSLTLSGADKLSVKLSPAGNDIGFEISAGSLVVPFVPALTLSEFGMKGTANRQGVTSSEWDGRAFDGVISGSARIRWGASWTAEGDVRARGVKVAVFAPGLVSEGKVDAKGTYSMTGSTPSALQEGARLQGDFKIEKGVLGSFDLTRALQTGGAQSGGRTPFTELTGQGVYDKGTVQITNVSIVAGAMNAGASLNIDAGGGLSGRVVADVKAATQTLRATLNLSGKVQDPVIRK
jgi:hypothetical protein